VFPAPHPTSTIRRVPVLKLCEVTKTDLGDTHAYICTRGCQEFRELIVQPLSVLKEVVLVPAIELIPIFGGLAVISVCRN